MDIVGPLPRSRRENRFVLIICDYATRYPEPVPMQTVDAEVVAEEVMMIFSCVGLPKEILTDQGANLQSELLAELYKLLHILLRSSPYHPQTDKLVERFNKTLKDMLRKIATMEGKDWDNLLPYLFFAYREVLQESSGFSPFELLCGQDVCGPLDVLKNHGRKMMEVTRACSLHFSDEREAGQDEHPSASKSTSARQKTRYDQLKCQTTKFQTWRLGTGLTPNCQV